MNTLFTSILTASALSFLSVSCSDTTTESTTENQAPINAGRKLVMESINAHGGKQKWYSNGLLQFRWKYHLTDRGPDAIVDSTQTVDTTTLAVVHQATDKDITFGAQAGTYWSSPKGATFTPPIQFWALTPYYFLGIPFVFNDEGANFTLLEDTIVFEGKDYTQVKITFNPSSGDSPEDYYVLLIDPETKLTRGAYYTVTNKLVAPDGPGPAKFISLDHLVDVDGVMLASGHRTMKMEDGKIGAQMRFTEVSGVKFLPKDSVDLSIPNKDLIIAN